MFAIDRCNKHTEVCCFNVGLMPPVHDDHNDGYDNSYIWISISMNIDTTECKFAAASM